jgi:menaquinone-dependent protoporphyrinogen IX oxidase
MESIIVYCSKYGATKQYAEWLSLKMGILLAEASEITPIQLNKYDCIIIGSPVYIGKLSISQWLKKNLSSLINKKIFLFAVCGTDPKEKDKIQGFIDASVPSEIKNQCEVYFLRGRIVYKELNFWHKLLVRMGASIAKTPEEKAMLHGFDLVDEKNIGPLVNSYERYSIRKGKQPSFI